MDNFTRRGRFRLVENTIAPDVLLATSGGLWPRQLCNRTDALAGASRDGVDLQGRWARATVGYGWGNKQKCWRIISRQHFSKHQQTNDLHQSGREDLNLRPPAPEAGALPG